MYDIIIVGLGPAGAVLAAGLDSKFSVLCIDKKQNGGGFMKPCGGLLAPDAQKALAQLGLNLPKDVLVDPQIFSVRTIDTDNSLIRSYQRMYINLDRHKFDLWLMSEIPNNVTCAGGTVTKISRTAKGFSVSRTENGQVITEECRYLVGADGAKSAVRKLICPDLKTRSYLAVQQWFRDENPVPFYSCIFDSKITDCYSWTVSKDGSFIFGGAYPRKNARSLFEQQKKKLSALGMHFGEPIKTEACLVLRPTGLNSFCCADKGVFLVGEAAGFISPSSLEGISSAVISAAALAEAFNRSEKSPEETYRKAMLSLRLKLTAKLLKCPFMYNPFLRSLVMKSGIMTVNVKNGDKFN